MTEFCPCIESATSFSAGSYFQSSSLT